MDQAFAIINRALKAGIARLPGGLLLVADEGNGRAQLFRRTDAGTRP